MTSNKSGGGSGHKVDTGDLTRVGRQLTAATDDVEPTVKAVEEIQVASDDFGMAHTSHFNYFQSGIEKAAGLGSAFITATEEFAGRLTGASKQYAADDSAGESDMASKNPEVDAV